jgi:uncharacterized protein
MRKSERELNRLDELLISLPPESDAMLLSEFDGFAAGIIVCPELIMPKEWLPVVWGDGEEGPFNQIDEAEELVSLIMEHYNRVIRTLSDRPKRYTPIIDVDQRNDDLLWEFWIDGFNKAMRLRPDSWDQIIEGDDQEARASLLVLVSLIQLDDEESELSEDGAERLSAMAPDIIPKCVTELNRWRIENVSAPAPSEATETTHGRKVGRNDPCPCGSGRKYKRCCGAN